MIIEQQPEQPDGVNTNIQLEDDLGSDVSPPSALSQEPEENENDTNAIDDLLGGPSPVVESLQNTNAQVEDMRATVDMDNLLEMDPEEKDGTLLQKNAPNIME